MKLSKRLASLLLVLAMVFSMLPAVGLSASAANVEWKEVQWADLTTDDVFIITTTTGGTTYLMNSKEGTGGTPKLGYKGTITSKNGVNYCSFNDVSEVEWKKDASNRICVASDSGSWIYTGTKNNKLRVGSGTDGNIWSVDGDYLKSNKGRYLSIYSTTDFRSYTNKQGGQVTRLFKAEAVSSFTVTPQSSDETMGTVSVSGNTITASPKPGYRVTGNATYDSSKVTVTYSGNNTFEITELKDNCTVTIEFAAKTPATLTYSENGQTTVAAGPHYVGDQVALDKDPAAAPSGYEFIGWSANTVAGQDEKPALIEEPVTLAGDTTVYAVYAVASEGGGSGNYEKATDSTWLPTGEGTVDVVFANKSKNMAFYSDSFTAGATVGKSKAVEFTESGAIAGTVGDPIRFTIAKRTDGGYSIKSVNGVYIGSSDDQKNNMQTGTSDSYNNTIKNNEVFGSSGKGSKLQMLNQNGTSIDTKFYKSSQIALDIYVKQGGGTTYSGYTTHVDVGPVYNVNVQADPEAGGTVSISNGVITAEAKEGYTLTGDYTVVPTGAADVTYHNDGTFTVDAHQDCTVKVAFEAKPQVTLSFVTPAGVTAEAAGPFYKDEPMTLPTPAGAPTGGEEGVSYTFVGWAEAESMNAEQAPAYLEAGSSYTPADSKTFYALYTYIMDDGSAPAPDAPYVPTDPAILSTGDTVALVGGGHALSTTGTQYNKEAKAVTPTDGEIAAADLAGCLWTLEKTAGGYRFKNGNTVLAVETSGTHYNLKTPATSDADTWTVTESGTGYEIENQTHTGRYISYNSSKTEFSPYTNATKMQFYSQKSGTPVFTTTITSAPKHTVTWNYNNGDEAFQQTLRQGTEIQVPAAPVKADDEANHQYFTFVGWYTDAGCTAGHEAAFPVTVGDQDLAFYAKFDTHTYATVNWIVEGTTTTEYYRAGETPAYKGEAPVKPGDDENNYTFDTWTPAVGAVTEGQTYDYTAKFTATPIVYEASISVRDTIRVGKTATAVATLSKGGEVITTYAPVFSVSSDPAGAVEVNPDTGVVTGNALGTATVIVTYNVGTKTYTAEKNIAVVAASASAYTLMTRDNAPADWSGDYIFVARRTGNSEDFNNIQIMTPKWTGDQAIVEDGNQINGESTNASNNASSVTWSADGIGTINSAYTPGDTMEMQSSGAISAGGYTVMDEITDIPETYAFTLELVDDINNYYTIRVKNSGYYLASDSKTSSNNNGLQYSLTANDERALWQLRWATEADGLNTNDDGYTPDVLLIESVYGLKNNVHRCILMNTQGWKNDSGTDNARFRVYGSGAYNTQGTQHKLAKPGAAGNEAYNIFLYGNPNPFNAKIYYNGDERTLAKPVEVIQGRTEAVDLESMLLPDINDYPNWEIVGGPDWYLSQDSSGVMEINKTTGVGKINGAPEGTVAIVTVDYTLHDKLNNVNHHINTQTKVVVKAPETTYSTVIYETASGNDTEVRYNVSTKTNSLPLAAYVVNDLTGDNSKTGSVVMGGTLSWSAKKAGTDTTVPITDGVLDLSGINEECIVEVTVSGATGDTKAATDATFKVYVKHVAYTAEITHNGETGNFEAPAGSITLGRKVLNANNEEPGTVYTLDETNAEWTIMSGNATIQKNTDGTATLDTSLCQPGDKIKVRLRGMKAVIDGTPALIATVPAAYVIVTVVADTTELVKDTLVLDFGLPMTFDPTINDGASGTLAGICGNADGTFGTELALNWGTATVSGNSITVTPNAMIEHVVTFYYKVGEKVGTIELVPASTIYYEDTFGNGVFTFTPADRWSTDGTTEEAQQRADFLGVAESNVYGYDAAYETCAEYSMGSAHVATVDDTNWKAVAEFDFYGTGFDLISLTGGDTGTIKVSITDAQGKEYGRDGCPLTVDTFYGFSYNEAGTPAVDKDGNSIYIYKYVGDGNGDYIVGDPVNPPAGSIAVSLGKVFGYDKNLGGADTKIVNFVQVEQGQGDWTREQQTSHWSVDKNAASTSLYQIPVIKVRTDAARSYHVKVSAIYQPFYDNKGTGSYKFVFDAVRIYDPCGEAAAQDAYKTDGEDNAHYLNIRDQMVTGVPGSDCPHANVSGWTLKTPARYSADPALNGRGRFTRTCTDCGFVVENAYYYVTATVNPASLDKTDPDAAADISYTVTCDNPDVLEILNGLTFTEDWASANTDVMTVAGQDHKAYTNSTTGTTYATLGLTGSDGKVYAEGIRSNDVTVTEGQPVETYTVTYYENGTQTGTSADVEAGQTVVLPGAEVPADYAGKYTFTGWAEAALDADTETEPTLYNAGTDYTVNGNKNLYAVYTYDVTGSGTGSGAYTLLKSNSDLTADQPIVIAALGSDVAMGGQGDNNRAQVAITKAGDTLTFTSEVAEFTLIHNDDGTYSFQDGTAGYLYAASGSKNYLRTQKNIDGNASFTIEIAADGTATVTAQGTNSHNKLKYNSNSSIFSCYSSGQQDIALYQKAGGAATTTYYATTLVAPEEPVDVYAATVTPDTFNMTAEDMATYTVSLTKNGTVVPSTEYTVEYQDQNAAVAVVDAGGVYAYTPGDTTSTLTFQMILGDAFVDVATATITIHVDAAAPAGHTATFTTPDTANVPAAVTGETVTMPTLPAYTKKGVTYSFLGWMETAVDNVTAEQTFIAPGTSVPLTGDKTYKALYTYTVSGGAAGEGTVANSLTDGDEIIIAASLNGGTEYFFDGTDSAKTSRDAAKVYTVADKGNGNYTLKNGTKYLQISGKYPAESADEQQINIAFSNNKAILTGSGGYMLNLNGTLFRGYTHLQGTNEMTLYKLGGGTGEDTTYYTTEIPATNYEVTVTAGSKTLNVDGTTTVTSVLKGDGVRVTDYTSVEWTSSQPGKVSITSSGETCTATAVAVGSSQIRATYTVDGQTKYGYVTITVSSGSEPVPTPTDGFHNPSMIPVNHYGAQPDYTRAHNVGQRGVICTALSSYAETYYSTHTSYGIENLTGSALETALGNLMTDTHAYQTGYKTDCKVKANLSDCENGDEMVHMLYSNIVGQPAADAGDQTLWNKEHVWPQSKGGSDSTDPGSDLHHIRPDDPRTNSIRGNKSYGVAASGKLAYTGDAIEANVLGGRSDANYFEPLDEVKGDVARICLYLYVRYGVGGNDSRYTPVDKVFQSAQLMLDWCKLDPVDTWEMSRNDVIEGITGNRNVFIDHPEYAWKMMNQTVPADLVTPTSAGTVNTASVDPQPAVRGMAAPVKAEPAEITEPAAKGGTETTTDTANDGIYFIDGNGSASLALYDELGPANEVYLAKGKAITFSADFNVQPEHIMIGMKTILGSGTGTITVTTGTGSKDITVSSATDMYYDLTDIVEIVQKGDGSGYTINGQVTVMNKDENGAGTVVSLTNIKWTTGTPTRDAKMITYVTPAGLKMALASVNEILGNDELPEEPGTTDPETEEPGTTDPETEEPGSLFRLHGASMVVGNSLEMNFFVEKADLGGRTDLYAKITKAFADGREDAVKTVPFARWQKRGDSLLYVAFDGIAAKEMNDRVCVQIFDNNDVPVSALWEDSVHDYALRGLRDPAAADGEKSVLVDMLNYGAAAQRFFKYNTENPANADIDEYQKYATLSVDCDNKQVKGEHYYGTTLMLKSNIVLTMYFTDVTPDMYAVVTYTNHYGEEKRIEISGDSFINRGDLYGVAVENLAVSDIRQLVTCTVYNADGSEFASASDSMESYIARGDSEEIYTAVLNFGSSAYQYFLAQKAENSQGGKNQ